MGSQSSSKQSSSGVQTTAPDPLTDQWRQQTFNLANGMVGQTPPQQQVAPLSPQTQSGLGALQKYAQGGVPNLNAANDASARILSGGNPAASYAQDAASGGLYNMGARLLLGASQTKVAPTIANMIGGASQQNPWASLSADAGQQQTTAGVDTLKASAGGQHQNQYLDSLFNAASRPVTDAVNANFAQAGRYGANAAHTGALTRELGSLASSIYAPAMENERNRQLQSAGQLAGLQQSDRAAQLQGYGQAGSLYEAGAGRGLAGAGMYGDALSGDAARRYQGAADFAGLQEAGLDRQLAGTGLYGSLYNSGNAQALQAQAQMPSLYALGAVPGALMGEVGGAYDAQNQAQLDAQYANQNAPWARLQDYSAMMSGMPVFGTTTSTGNSTTKNRGMNVGWNYQTGLSIGG